MAATTTSKFTPWPGRTSFPVLPVRTDRLPWRADVPCVVCGRPFQVARGGLYATFKAGNEVLGLCCDVCLTPEAKAMVERQRLAALAAKEAK